MGYRYFDKAKLAPLFPFGHGLSYTTFAFSDLRVIKDGAGLLMPVKQGDIETVKFAVSFKVKNTGSVPGKEVAQVYIRDIESSLARPEKELKAFRKVALDCGDEKEVTLELDRDAFKYWDNNRDWWVAEKGTFEILVGSSSADTPLKATVELGQTFHWRGL